MLKLKSSARLKKRYLLIDADGKETVEKAILDYIGILGFAKAAAFFVPDARHDKKIILAVERGSVDEVRAAFEMCKDNIKVLRVSGTLEGLSKK